MKKIVVIFITSVVLLLMVSSVVGAEGPYYRYRYVDNVYFDNPRWVTTWVDANGIQRWQANELASRRPSGVGGSVSFQSGEAVIGFRIVLADGRVADTCYLNIAPVSGTVIDGVVNPWVAEVNRPPCWFFTTAAPAWPAPLPQVEGQRQPSGVSGTLRFERGWRVAGYAIRYDSGYTVYQCYDPNTLEGGFVQDGVVWPWLAEVANLRNCR